MIQVKRGAEPVELASLRLARLGRLRSLGREPMSTEIEGYKVVAEELWRAQYFKCCYCETKIPKGNSDVEHYRPKCEADRRPGSMLRHGYWWLAYDWNNLLFACSNCNRSGKNSKFPLDHNSNPLVAELAPPGQEVPLLIDPSSSDNPIEHIQFVCASIGSISSTFHWWARPRNRSVRGNMTIEVCKLNRVDLLELRSDYVYNIIMPHVNALSAALASGNRTEAQSAFERASSLLGFRHSFVGLAFDALRTLVADSRLMEEIGKQWPRPEELVFS